MLIGDFIGRNKRVAAIVAIALALAIAIAVASCGRGEDPVFASGELYAPVQKGPLVINLEENGEIAPSQQLILKSEVQGRTSIIYLVPEGQIVREGELLVELDASDKTDEMTSQEITVQNAESNYNVARENLEIVRNQADADIELAELNKQFAEEDLVKYEEGE